MVDSTNEEDLPPIIASPAEPPSGKPGRCTGPRSPEGKLRSSQNPTKHGSRSHILILHGEKQEDLDDLYDRWKEAYQPDTDAALELVEQLVLEKWFLLRNERRYSEVEEQLSYFPFTKWNPEQHKIYQLALRYKTAAARSASKAQRDLEDYLKNRRTEDKYQQQLNEDARASYWQMQKEMQKREQALDEALNEAEARGIDVSGQKTEIAAAKKQNRAKLTRMGEAAAAFEGNKTRAQMLFQGQNSPKKLRRIPVLEQWVEITVRDGITSTSLTPSNEKLIERGQTMYPPPELVYRRLHFPHGIPAEYDWISPDPQFRKYGGGGIQRMSVDSWLDLIDEEKLAPAGHIGPCPNSLPRPKEHGGCDCPFCTRCRDRLEGRLPSEEDDSDLPESELDPQPNDPPATAPSNEPLSEN